MQGYASIELLPASCRDRHPPQTEAMEEEPLLSVIVLSTLMVYGKSSCTIKRYLKTSRQPQTSQHRRPPIIAPDCQGMYCRTEAFTAAPSVSTREVDVPPRG